jgi:hypothetical protein
MNAILFSGVFQKTQCNQLILLEVHQKQDKHQILPQKKAR